MTPSSFFTLPLAFPSGECRLSAFSSRLDEQQQQQQRQAAVTVPGPSPPVALVAPVALPPAGPPSFPPLDVNATAARGNSRLTHERVVEVSPWCAPASQPARHSTP